MLVQFESWLAIKYTELKVPHIYVFQFCTKHTVVWFNTSVEIYVCYTMLRLYKSKRSCLIVLINTLADVRKEDIKHNEKFEGV